MNDDYYWDRIYIHYCTESWQSCQDVAVACGKRLSTWAAPDLPWKQSGNKYGTEPSSEKDLGYSFACEPVTCAECITWMEKNLNHCKVCSILCKYYYCPVCSEKELIKDGLCIKCRGIPCCCKVDQNKVDERFILWQRNVADKYKDVSTEDIKKDLQGKCFPSAIFMSQIEGDFNISSIIRSANNFNLSKVFYYGRKKFDKRGCCGTHHYIDVIFLSSIEEVVELKSQYNFVGLDNNIDRQISQIKNYEWKDNSLIIVGEENAGIPSEILDICDDYVEIPSLGSVRSLNAAVAGSIAMYDYVSKFRK